MHPVRVLAACLCLATSQCTPVFGTPTIARTTQSVDASATSGGQAKGTRSPVETHAPNPPTTTEPQHYSTSCKPQRIDVKVMEDQPMVVNYTVVVDQPNSCSGPMHVVDCVDNTSYKGSFQYSVTGSVCMKYKNSYRLKYKHVESKCFSLSGTKLIHEDVKFENDGEASVTFHQLPQWVKRLKVNLVAMNRTIAGKVDIATEEKVQKIIVPGNYAVDQNYFLWYSPVILQEGIGTKCRDLRHEYSTPFLYNKEQRESESDAEHTKTVLILSITAGVSFLLLVALVINIYLCRTSDGARRPSLNSETPLFVQHSEPTSDKSDGDVVLVHAQDTARLARLCQDLKAAVTKYCGRRVVDISLSDAQRLASPETWLLQMLSSQNNTVLLVMSPALAAVHRALQHGNDAAGCEAVANVRGEMRPWDVLLPICLQYLQEHLSQNYVRLFVVRFEEVSSSEVHDISELVPFKRFLLPQHQLELQSALNISHV